MTPKQDRIKRLRDLCQQKEIDAVLIHSRENTRYFSGFTGTESTLLITHDACIILVDSRYTTQAAEQCIGYTVYDSTLQGTSALVTVLRDMPIFRLGIEDEVVSFALYRKYKSDHADIKFLPLESALDQLRTAKDEDELASIRRAVAIADQAFAAIIPLIRPGVVERTLAFELETEMRRRGAEKPSFDTIVASGARSALPHGVASDKQVEYGDCIVFDFGCIYQGYCSDITRTLFVGKADPELTSVYQVVLSAQMTAERMLGPGVTGAQADAAARKVIADAGYGEWFGHGLGHGVGLAIHEQPRLSRTNPGALQPGDVVTVEPGIYLPGKGGVRIEDIAVITHSGAEILTASPKDMLIL